VNNRGYIACLLTVDGQVHKYNEPTIIYHDTCSAEKQRYMQYKLMTDAGKMDPLLAVTEGMRERTENTTQRSRASVMSSTLKEHS
jgi:hypothetical protein